MDSDILKRLKKFNLLEEEDKGFRLEAGDVQISHDECKRSLIGKLFGSKKASFTGLRNTLNGIWSTAKPFKICELSCNLFQFTFELEEDKLKIFHGRPWTFDGQYLILKPWSEEMNIQTETFSNTLMWIQVWNLPTNWLSKGAGFRFRNVFDDVLDVIIPETGSKRGRHMKILASVNLEKPLLRGTKIQFSTKSVWVDFRYEHLAVFCYYCGRVGHLEKNCVLKRGDISSGSVKQDQYGEWLRAVLMSKQFRRTTEKITERESAGRVNPQMDELGTGNKDDGLNVGESSKGSSDLSLPELREIAGDKVHSKEYINPENTMRDGVEMALMIDDTAVTLEERVILNKDRLQEERVMERSVGGCETGIMEQFMQMEHQQNYEMVYGSTLVNIPILEEDTRSVFQDLESNVSTIPRITKYNNCNKRWTRLAGKENRIQLGTKAEGQASEAGSKRTWKLVDENEDEENGEPRGTCKKQKNIREGSCEEVVVANLNWPQLNQ